MKKKQTANPKKGLSLFRKKIEDVNYSHDAELNRSLDSFGIKIIKAVGITATIIGICILVAIWVWIIRWLYKVW